MEGCTGAAVTLRPPGELELEKVHPFGGQVLSSFSDAYRLPFVRKDHDLNEVLAFVVIQDANPHPRRPQNEITSIILSTTNLSRVVMAEMKRYGLAFKSFANVLNVNAATFSLGLREPRHWFDTNFSQKKTYYMLYLWLNLPQRYREATFKSDFALDELKVPHLDDIPRIEALTSTLAKELDNLDVELDTFAAKVLRNEETDLFLLRNMIQTPLVWDMMSSRMKKLYMLAWHWLKQSSSKRMSMLGIAPKDFLDTTHVANQVLNQLKDWNFSMASLVSDVNKGLPLSVMSSLLHRPLDWSICRPHEKYMYLSLVEWLGHTIEDHIIDGLDIDTNEIGHASIAFIKENNITVTEFAEKVAKFPRANVSLYFNSPIAWSRANPALRAAFINVCFWMDLDPERRLERLLGKPTGAPKAKPEELTKVVVEEQNEDLPPPVEALEGLNEIMVNIDRHSNGGDYIDTSALAMDMKQCLRKVGVSIKSFAKVVKVNRNYFSQLINAPTTWDKATKLQKFVYQVMQQWLSNKGIISHAGSQRVALKPITNGQQPFKIKSAKANKSGFRQARVKFSAEQRQYLLEKFKENPRPNHAEKMAISKHLGVSLRTIVIFFCNRRSRFSSQKTKNVLTELSIENK